MQVPAIELKGVGKAFGSLWAVRDLDLTVPRGCVFALLGPNGAGKTTTLRMITGLLRPDRGTIRIHGLDLERDYLAVRRLFSYIPDEGHLFEKLTGREFLAFVWSFHFRTPPDAARIDRALDEVGLRDRADVLIEQYSHGMRQRLLFAMARLRGTPLWIIDEPIIGLDPHAVRMVQTWFREHAAQGGTVFLSTHLLALAETICDRVAILHEGRLVAAGTVAEIRRLARRPTAFLEDVFLRLTRSPAPAAPSGGRGPAAGHCPGWGENV